MTVTDNKFEVDIKNFTVGAHLPLNKDTRLVIDVTRTTKEAPDWGSTADPNDELSELKNV